MANYISDLGVSLNEAEQQERLSRGYKCINADLNKGAGGNYICLWYKKEPSQAPITRIQFTFNSEMGVGLIKAGYTKIDKNLNAGARGDHIYLWYFRGSTEYDVPIVDIDVTTDAGSEAPKFGFGWERLTCDLNRTVKGSWIHTWVKRERQTYICNVAATDSFRSDTKYFKKGFIRLDEDTNRGVKGAFVFIWYRQTTDPSLALSDLQVSTNRSERHVLHQQDYKPVSVNLNEGTASDPVYLWYKQEQNKKPIKALTLLLNSDAFELYERAGSNVIKKNLYTGNKSWIQYLCFYQ